MKRLLLVTAAAMLIAAPVYAHNQWIKPSATTVSGADGWVTFDAAASTDVFNADHNPMQLDGIKVTAPDGTASQIENGMRGRYRSTFDVHLTKPGTWKIGTENIGIQGSYKLNGEEFRVGGRGGGGGPGGPGGPGMQGGPGGPGAQAGAPPAGPGGPGGRGGNPNAKQVSGGADFVLPAGATEVNLTMNVSRNEVLVTLGKPSELKLSGKGLEMQPISHPSDLVADEAGKFRFLVDGKPAANLEIEVVPDGRRFRNSQGEIKVKTDAKGEAKVKWTGAGLYWMKAAFEDKTSPQPGVSGRRFQYITTLEVMAP